ncbi:PREDICTED: probable disease resistance protein At5g63020 [Prunus mume]|uniref:Probable disease resistance protein At5g63020 n=1 Tax=Prunus mume TaxID=102107 RepID=A0ABM0PSM5_PRUMU|nr:PREDICTED: probable disease resistance protein At5g63020 [Prunus mume]
MGSCLSISLSCDDIVSRCWDSVFERVRYVRNLQENLQALSTSLQELKALKDDVQRKVELAERQPGLKRLKQVNNWILRAEALETEINEVIISHSTQEIEKLCCGGYCSKNCRSSYKYGKKVARKLVEVEALKSKGVFEEVVAESLPTALVDVIPSEPTVGMEPIFDQVWSHVEDEQVGMIGLYGMGGVGKTTLLTQIHNNFNRTRNDFNLVIWIVVSKGHKIEVIQDKIGEKIGLSSGEWKHKEQREKAKDIFGILNTKKFVLLMDDLWEPVELTEVGVPAPDSRNKFKIVFTTRSEEVCGQMDAQKKIKVGCLTWEKAWNLFQEKVGKETLLLHPDIPEHAEIVAKECGGLPLALITVGRVMACKKTPQEWKHAVQVLRRVASEFSGMGDKVFPLLKFSYDNLPSQKVRSCFLYCALFPEDFVILKDDLVYFWMCEEDILDEYGNVEEAKNESYHIIGTLLASCLLEDEGDSVKMHDVIRDMALWLAWKEGENILVDTGAYHAPHVAKWWNAKRVSLMGSGIKSLDETPRSPNLLTLFLRGRFLKRIVDDFFDFMPTLRVLDLSENNFITQLPTGVANLVSLQHLNLSKTGIKRLPVELAACARLKHLNLEYTYDLDYVPPNILSNFPRLKVLRILYCGSSNRVFFYNEKTMIDELQGLKHLDVLSLTVGDTSCFLNLDSHHILVTCTLTLCLMGENPSSYLDLSDVAMANMKYLDTLLIKRTVDVYSTSITRLENPNCFLGLQFVVVVNCTNLKNLEWLVFAPNLIHLEVYGCSKMTRILGLDTTETTPFAKLTVLRLSALPQLWRICENPLPVPFLKEIHISGCPVLTRLPLNSSSAQTSNLIIEGQEEWWNGLEWEDQEARKAFLPCFRPF